MTIAEIDAALVAASGDRKVAAEALGISYGSIGAKIAKNPVLMAKWGRRVPAKSGQAPAIIKPGIAWAKLGATEASVLQMQNFEEAAGMGMMQMMAVCQGGAMRAYMEINAQYDRVILKLRACEENPKTLEDGTIDYTEWQMWHTMFIDLSTQIRHFLNTAATTTKQRVELQGKIDEITKTRKKLVLVDEMPGDVPDAPSEPNKEGDFTMQPKPTDAPAVPANQ